MEKTMDLHDALRGRKTIRGYLKQPVPQSVIREILIDAHWAPSSSNQQPWHFHVLTARPLDDLCRKIGEARHQQLKAYDPSKGSTIPSRYVDRTKRLFKELRPVLSALGDGHRTFIESGSYRFYDAPAVIFLSMSRHLPKSRLMDIGMAVQNLMLSAHARGLGTCAIALTLLYAEVIDAALAIDRDHEVVLSIALGYPDDHFPVNSFRSSRDDVSGFIVWQGFEA